MHNECVPFFCVLFLLVPKCTKSEVPGCVFTLVCTRNLLDFNCNLCFLCVLVHTKCTMNVSVFCVLVWLCACVHKK
jgi:hypothetical protein